MYIYTYIYIYMVRRLAFQGGPGTHVGLRGLLGPSLHTNLDPEALHNPEPRPKIACCSIIWQTTAYYSML